MTDDYIVNTPHLIEESMKSEVHHSDHNRFLTLLKDEIDANVALKNTGCTYPGAELKLNTGEAKPVFVRQYNIAEADKVTVTEQVDAWYDSGVLRDAPANSQWNSSLLVAPKRCADGVI